MSVAPRLFCLDTVLIDVVLKVSALPVRAGDALASEKLVATGGGFNAMSAAARHDMSVIYAGRLGKGPFSSLATRDLERENISIPIDRNDTLDAGICIVLLESDGERSFVTSPGAEATLRPSDLASLDVASGDIILVSGYNVMYPDLAAIVLAWVASLAADVVVAFDPATRMVDIPKENLEFMLDRADWLLCNESEASALSGEDDAQGAANALARRRDTLNVLVRRGAKGCVVARHGARASIVDGFATVVVDTNGAGDVHNGVFVAELASGHDDVAAARWANAAAAMAVAQLGPATGPRREDVERWMEAFIA